MGGTPRHGGGRLWALGCALLLGAAPGCGRPSSTQAAEATVRGFFEALPSEDCAVLGPLLAPSVTRGCQPVVRELREHGYALVEVLRSKVDGRDSGAVLVWARVSRHGVPREEPLVLRVERHEGRWRLRL